MKIKKKCLNCGKFFEANMITTKYCSHKCNAKHYKLRKKEESQSEDPNFKKEIEIPYDAQLKKIQIQEYLSIKDVTFMLEIKFF
jgi:predicted  nucleic acid-binding Zn-ribbon protein